MRFLNSRTRAQVAAPSRTRSGLTLVEVVLGMFLLATLLVAMLRSFNDQRNQIRNSGLRIEAAQAADELLTQWMTGSAAVPVNASGTWNSDWLWQTRLIRRTAFQTIPINVVALELRSATRPTRNPLVTVEFADSFSESAP